jgi:hypothetical protein
VRKHEGFLYSSAEIQALFFGGKTVRDIAELVLCKHVEQSQRLIANVVRDMFRV